MSKLNRLMASKNNPRPRAKRARNVPRVIEDKTVAFERPAERERWEVVMLSPQANDGTLQRIDAAGFDVWRPRTVILITAASVGKAVYVNRPLWPRYAFVGRRGFCGISLSDVPQIGRTIIVGSLSGATVQAIASREERGEFDCRELVKEIPAFECGAPVQTLDGLMEGIVKRSEEERVFVLMEMMGSERIVEIRANLLKRKVDA